MPPSGPNRRFGLTKKWTSRITLSTATFAEGYESQYAVSGWGPWSKASSSIGNWTRLHQSFWPQASLQNYSEVTTLKFGNW